MPLLRKILFYVFVLIYLFFCPLIILQALGYFVKPHAQKTVVETGLISLATAPAQATVYVENKKYTRKTPVVLRGLLPGSYNVRLLLKNYRPWSAAITVEPGKATVFDKIILIPQNARVEELLSEECEELIPVAGTRYFLVSKGFKLKDWYSCDAEEKQCVPLARSKSPFKQFTFVSCFTVERSSHVLFYTLDSQGEDRFLWGELRKDEVHLKDITPLFSGEPQKVVWDPNDPRYLFVFKSGTIDRANLQAQSLLPRFLEGVRGYGLYDRMVYYITGENKFERTDTQKRYTANMGANTVETQSLFGNKDFFQVKLLSRDIVLFLGERGELFSNLLPYRFVENGVEGTAYFAQNKQLLVWQKERIGILDFSKERSREDIFQRGPRLAWLYENGKSIEQVFWMYDGSQILFRDKDKLFLLELNRAAEKEPEFLFAVRRKSSILYHEDTGRLFYLDEHAGKLLCLQLVPQTEIITFSFPEKRTEDKTPGVKESSSSS